MSKIGQAIQRECEKNNGEGSAPFPSVFDEETSADYALVRPSSMELEVRETSLNVPQLIDSLQNARKGRDMNKIREALQYAYKKKNNEESTYPVTFEEKPPVNYAMARPASMDLEFREEMLGLYKMIDSLLPNKKSRFIQFIGARPGEGTSTLIREFAKLCADHLGHSVLLLDADRGQGTHHKYFDIPGQFGWVEALRSIDRIQDALYRIGDSNLVVSPASNAANSTPGIYNSPVFDDLCQAFRSEFEIVLVDSAPFATSPDCLAMASKVDGVVIVVEAEKTKWQVAKTLRDSIDRVGGNILGVIFNKRRFYIPPYIYKFL